jgi:hypothetical protein
MKRGMRMMTTKTKTVEDLLEFHQVLSNAIMELWALGQAGATRVCVVNVGWSISLAIQPMWVVTLGNVDRYTEPELMEKLNLLMRQTKFGKETIDVYSEWADESDPEYEAITGYEGAV